MKWQQAQRLIVGVLLATFACAGVSLAQGNYSGQTIKWDDYTFKFLPGGQMAQVFGADGKVVGTLLLMNGELQAVPLPGPDADKLKKSFEDWKAFQRRAGGNAGAASAPSSASAPTPATVMPGSTVIPPPSTTPLGPSKIIFDDAGQTPTVTRTDGVTVSFLGEQIKIAGYGAQNYLVRHEKANPNRFLRSTVGGANTRVMGSLSGAGEQFLVDGGGLMYDSGMGIVVGVENDKQLLIPKKLSIIIVAAVAEIRATPGHEKFDPPGLKSLKEISEYHLKSDGTQH